MYKRQPFVQTESNISKSPNISEESSNQFSGITPAADIDAIYISRLSLSGNDDLSEEATKSKLMQHSPPAVVKNSLWTDDKSHWYERSQLTRYDTAGSRFASSLLDSQKSKTPTSPTVVTDDNDSQRESIRATLLRRFHPSQLIVSDSIKRRVLDGLERLAAVRSAPTICSHTRQKLADYINQSRKDAVHERLPLRPIDEKLDQSDISLQRRLPLRPHRRVYSEIDYVSGGELSSPTNDVITNSDSDCSVDFEDLGVSDNSTDSLRSLVRNKVHQVSTVHH